MTVRLIMGINRYIGAAADTKPTGVPAESTFYEQDTGATYVTYDDGTNWVASSDDVAATVALDTVSLARLGSLTETAPASDTASSGLNGRLQRIAQRLTSLIALIPAALSLNGGLKVGVPAAAIQATLNGSAPTIAAAGDYSAGHVLSESATTGHAFVFPNAMLAAGGSGWITRLLCTLSVDAAVPTLRVWFFRANPANSVVNDRSAFSIAAADRALLIGYLDLPAMIDGGAVAVAQNISERIHFTAGGAETSVYAIVQTTIAFTNESASMTMTLEIEVEQD